jgi:threonine aldolase
MIDLRSDTVTKPTRRMLEAMWKAPVGDDVFDEDPSIRTLEEQTAAFFGMEKGLFCPSGTMTNQIAVKIQTGAQTEVICHKYSHIHLYEAGGIASNAHAAVHLLEGDRGLLTASDIAAAIQPDNIHYPDTNLVSLENTMNKGGGSIYKLQEIEKISALCQEKNINLHLDGARLWNALVAQKQDPKFYGKHFDSISVCFSKGMGCPVGSVLLMNESLYRKAKKARKSMGGGMRQAGYLAAAALYALDHHLDRLAEDHQKAQALAECLKSQSWVTGIMPVETNIVIAEVSPEFTPAQMVEKLKAKGLLAVTFGAKEIRLVTHLDFSEVQLEEAMKVLGGVV